MSYLVLARKLRPQRFGDLIGQDPISHTLQNALKQNRVAHAFLFTGPRGTGKTSSARILTKAINCLQPLEGEPCNACENCNDINQGIAQDVMEIDAASNRGIEHIRELRENVKFSPAKFPYKTYIIDEVHMLTTESFNALLKTLEEPPDHVKFILATTDYHKVPITVISRCQRYDFQHIPQGLMVAYLMEVAQAEGIQISEGSLHQIAKASVGGMRDALTTLDMLISFSGNQIAAQEVEKLLGINNQTEIQAILTAMVEKNLAEALANFQQLIRRGTPYGQILQDLMSGVKELALIKALRPEQLNWKQYQPEQLALYQRLAEQSSGPSLEMAFQILLELEQQIKRSAQAQLCLEMGLIKLCSLDRVQGVAEVIGLLREAQAGKKKTLLH